MGRDGDVVARCSPPGPRGGPPCRVHGAGGDRDLEYRGARERWPACERAGGAAARGHARRRRSAAGRGVRRARRRGRPAGRGGRSPAHPLRERRRVHRRRLVEQERPDHGRRDAIPRGQWDGSPAGPRYAPPCPRRQLRRGRNSERRRGARPGLALGRGRAGDRRRPDLGDGDGSLQEHAALAACDRRAADGVHRAGWDRDLERREPRGAHPAGRGASGFASGSHARGQGRAAGRGIRGREHGGRPAASCRGLRSHPLRGRRHGHGSQRLDR